MPQQFDNPISVENAYRLLCIQSADEGARDSISSRGWIKYSSWYDARVMLADGSYIYRDFAYGDLHHSNVTVADVLADFGIEVKQ